MTILYLSAFNLFSMQYEKFNAEKLNSLMLF